MSRILSAGEQNILRRPDFQIHARLLIEDVPLENLVGGENPLLQATITSDIEQLVQTGSFTCALGRGSSSLSPYLSAGAKLGGIPALDAGRVIFCEVQCVAPGSGGPTGEWRKVFKGLIDEPEVNPPSGTVSVQCRDYTAKLLDTEIENISTVSPDASVVGDNGVRWGFPLPAGDFPTVMQYILNTASGYTQGGIYSEPLAVVGAPNGSVSESWQDRTNLYEALRAIGVGKNGWELRGRWDVPGFGQDQFILTYYEPGGLGLNSMIAVLGPFPGLNWTITQIQKLRRSGVGVRNVAEVTPADAARVPVVSVNAQSLSRYDRRFLAVAEDKASHIDNAGEAADLGTAIVTAGGFPRTAIELTTPFYWFFELGDLFIVISDFDTNGQAYSYDQDNIEYGTTRTELHYDRGKGSLVLAGRETGPAAAMAEWRKASQRARPKRSYGSLLPPSGPAADGALWITVLDDTVAT